MPDPKPEIIVVDDDLGMNQAIARLLNAAGCCVRTFPSAEALLESGVARTAACLVLDVRLPGLSGFDLYRRLVQEHCAAPVVFITAYDDAASRVRARAAGAVAFITKPFDSKSLLAAIHRALEGGSRRRGASEPGQGIQ